MLVRMRARPLIGIAALVVSLGSCTGSSSQPPTPAGKRAPCTFGADQTCNGDASVSALWGHCTEQGVCECKFGFELAPSGYCRPAAR